MLTRIDKKQIADFQRRSAHYRQLASEANNEWLRTKYERHAEREARRARMTRIFPSGIAVYGLLVVVALLPWAILYRLGLGWCGVIPSVLVAAVIVRGIRGRYPRGVDLHDKGQH